MKHLTLELKCLPLLICLCLITGWNLFGQQVIRGSIREVQSENPIAFASIQILGKQIGVVSNSDGDFQIPVVYQELGDTMIISCIGYQQLQVPLSSLRSNELHVLRLQEIEYDLPEAIVSAKKGKKFKAAGMVRRALKNIPINFPSAPYSYLGYYRDYQKKAKEYINLNEAIVEVFDQGFQTKDRLNTQIKLYDYHSNTDFTMDNKTAIRYDNKQEKFIPGMTLTPFGGNELSILMVHDPIRNYKTFSHSFVNRLSREFIPNHTFKFSKPEVIGEVILHCIAFESKPDKVGPDFFAEGKIFIERENYAIHKWEYALYDEQNGARRLLLEVQLEYSRIEETMFLNYISFYNLFHIVQPPEFTVDSVEIQYVQLPDAPPVPELLIAFNNPPDMSTALKNEHYTLKTNGKKWNPTAVIAVDAKTVRLVIDREKMNNLMRKKDLKRTLKFGKIYDLNKNKLNGYTYSKVHQYRELFRQKVSKLPPFPTANEIIDRNTALADNPIQVENAKILKDFWMNTPLKN